MTTDIIDQARHDDLGEMEALLRAAALPVAVVRDFYPAGYVVVRAGGALVGCAGLETYG